MYNKKESTEDYLEKILMAQEGGKSIRAIDLAKYIGFTKASVSVALKKLKEEQFVVIDQTTGNITLTDAGRKIAEETYERHRILTTALTKMGVDEKIAEEDACKVEHLLSEESFQAIKSHVEKYSK